MTGLKVQINDHTLDDRANISSVPINQSPKQLARRKKIAGDIADELLRMRNSAKTHNLKFLTYFLEMAFQEAFSASMREPQKPEES